MQHFNSPEASDEGPMNSGDACTDLLPAPGAGVSPSTWQTYDHDRAIPDCGGS